MQLKKTGISILTQLSGLIGQLTNEQYRAPLGLLNDNTVGKHVRHILEFFMILGKGSQTGVVNCDARPHDVLFELNKESALKSIDELIASINTMTLEKPVTLEVSYVHDAGERVKIPSSLQRELAYNIEHSIHHMAIIKIAVKATFPSISLPSNFGVAYSTLRYHSEDWN